jgi:outer membrane protein assembly factor BamD
MMVLRKNYILILMLVILASCSGYNKVLKSDNYERKFELAGELYEKKQYLRSVALYEQIYQRVPKTAEGELAYYRLGKAYYFEGDYYMAGYYLGSFFQRFTYSQKSEECLFLSAMCSVKNSPDFTLDQNETELAINDLQQFINKFPESSLVDSCNKVMDQLHFKLEEKDYAAVKQYSNIGELKAAITTASTFLNDYPRSEYRETVYYVLVKNSYLITKNSIEQKKVQRIEETLERYRNFVAEFPNTKYKRELNSISDDLEKELQTITSK